MRILTLFALFLVMTAVTIVISADSNSQQVEIVLLTEQSWDAHAPKGKEVDAIYGDIVLRNQHVTAVIAQPKATRNANMTVRNVGGCLIDFATRDFESDQLSCFYPAGVDYAYSEWQVQIDDAGQIEVSNQLSSQGNSGSVIVTSPGVNGRPTVQTTYRLTAESKTLEMTTRYVNDSKKTVTLAPTDRIRADGGNELMEKSPNGTNAAFWIDDQYWQQAYVLTANGKRIQSNSDSRNSNLKYLSSSGIDLISISPEKSVELKRSFAVGRTRIDALQAAQLQESRQSKITVRDGKKIPVIDAVIQIEHEGVKLGVARTNQEGIAQTHLPIGACSLTVTRYGHSLTKAARVIEIAQEESTLETSLNFDDYVPGLLKLDVKDQKGNRLPAKVEIEGQEGTATPDFGPVTAEFAVKNLRYVHDGQMIQPLVSGSYLIRVSHGPEYSVEEIYTTVNPGESTKLPIVLARTIDTTGWVSADFHSHSTPSGDNTASQLGRVLNLLCEHIEFAPCTEHNRIDTYQHHFDALGINHEIKSVTGMELTGGPLPLNHQNVFPLHHHPHRQDGGGPITDGDVETQIRRVATWDNGSEKLVQQNHPDVGWLFYDKNGDGTHDAGHADGVAFIDVMEIHPIDRVLQTGKLENVTADEAKSNRIFKWLQLLNQGYRIPGVVNTDAHYNFHGSGWIRNWIRSSTDDPANIDHMEMVHASEAGHVVMSNGPFLEFQVTSAEGKTASIGDDLATASGKVTLEIAVQCPNWHSIDTVFVLVNGRAREDLIFTTESHPDLFSESGDVALRVQKFEKQLEIQLDADAHLIAVAGGRNSTLGPVFGPQWGKYPPTALTNPIFVDTDGDGFTPNKDTLGRPLPVKGD